MLTERPGHVVTREEIRQRLWRGDTFVDFERSINFCINQIRAALGDDAEKPRYVETLPRRGYRFITPVTLEVSRDPAPIVNIVTPVSQSLALSDEYGTIPSVSSGIQFVPLPPAREGAALRKRLVVLAAAITVSSLAGFAAHKWLSRSKGPGPQDLGITTLTDTGLVTGVAISPDGRYVAYAEGQGGKQGLWLNELAIHSESK